MMRAVTTLAGVVLVTVPVVADPRGLYPVAGLGLLCALVIGWPQRGAAAARRGAAAVRARAGIPARPEIAAVGPGAATTSPTGATTSPGAATTADAGGREPGPAGP